MEPTTVEKKAGTWLHKINSGMNSPMVESSLSKFILQLIHETAKENVFHQLGKAGGEDNRSEFIITVCKTGESFIEQMNDRGGDLVVPVDASIIPSKRTLMCVHGYFPLPISDLVHPGTQYYNFFP